MPASSFVDYVKIYCRSGKGGAGSTHLYRAKYIPKGGPDGGDGGRGGHIILKGDRNYWTLLHLRYQKHIMAKSGGDGGQSRSSGKSGADRIISVPIGTVAYDAETGDYITEVTENGENVILVKAGRGGRGNWHFKSPTNQTPRYAQPGEAAVEMNVVLELKVLADVGLVGFPNAGKSTLLSSISAARPKIANYAFTTLEASVGVVPYRDDKSFVMADIPGIIEGASDGKGLGHQFLRHIERNSLLLFLVPADSADITKEYNILLNELSLYNSELLDKQRILAISKSDMLDEELIEEIKKDLPTTLPTIFISSVANIGLTELKDLIWYELNREDIVQPAPLTHHSLNLKKIEAKEIDPELIPDDSDFEDTIFGTDYHEAIFDYDFEDSKLED